MDRGARPCTAVRPEISNSGLPYDRSSGTCTTCIQKCLEGEVLIDLAFAISDEELEKGYRLICSASRCLTWC
jgi:ferredoxin